MGYEDTFLKLAEDETFSSAGLGANSGDGGLGQQSVDLGLEPGGLTEHLRNYDSMGNGTPISLSLIVGTTVVGTNFGDTLEIQIASLPVNASFLDNGAGGAGDGKLLTKSGMTGSTSLLTFPVGQEHDIPLGTPVFLTTLGTGTVAGISINTVYYVVPTNRLSFRLATSLANALAGVVVGWTGTASDMGMSFAPALAIHASTGGILLWNAGVPTNQSALQANARLEVPMRPFLGMSPAYEFSGKHGAPTPATGFYIEKQPIGAGSGGPTPTGVKPVDGLVGAHAQQFYYLRYVPSDTITAGSLKKASLVLTGESQLLYSGSGFQVKG